MTDGLQVWMLINYCDVFLSFFLSSSKQVWEQRNDRCLYLLGCVFIYTWTRIYDYKVTSFPEEWMHAHRNLRFLWLRERRGTERKTEHEGLDVTDEDNDDNDDEEVMIDFYVADKRCRWWQMKRQTVLNFPHQHERNTQIHRNEIEFFFMHSERNEDADDNDEQSMGHERKAINAVIVRWQETSK